MSSQHNVHGFHHVAIAARDFERSVAFYTEGLGCVPFRSWGASGERAIMLDTGNGDHIEVFERPDHLQTGGRILHFALRVTDCRASHAVALAAGAQELRAPAEVDIPSDPPYPVTISFVTGPDGEEIEFFEER